MSEEDISSVCTRKHFHFYASKKEALQHESFHFCLIHAKQIQSLISDQKLLFKVEVFHQTEKITSSFYEIDQEIQLPSYKEVEEISPEYCIIELIFEIRHDDYKTTPYSFSIKCSVDPVFEKIEKKYEKMYDSKYLLYGLYKKTSHDSFTIDYFTLDEKELSIMRCHEHMKEIQSLLPEKLLCFRLKYSDDEFSISKQIGLYTVDSISKTIQKIDEISPSHSEIRLIGIRKSDYVVLALEYFCTVIDCEHCSDKTILKKLEDFFKYKYRCEHKGEYVWRSKESFSIKYMLDFPPGLAQLQYLYDLREKKTSD